MKSNKALKFSTFGLPFTLLLHLSTVLGAEVRGTVTLGYRGLFGAEGGAAR